MSSSKAETSPVRLLQDWYLLTRTLIWKESEPSLLRQIHLSFWFLIIARELARTIGLARETNPSYARRKKISAQMKLLQELVPTGPRLNDLYLPIRRDAPALIDLATRQDSRLLATGIKESNGIATNVSKNVKHCCLRPEVEQKERNYRKIMTAAIPVRMLMTHLETK
ncbi:hypothetical protein DY000_02012768, partial [Brassica cretica]